MDEIYELLTKAGRFWLLEDEMPGLVLRREELEKQVKSLKSDLGWAKLEVKNLEQPGFFQRLLGRHEEKLEQAQAEVRRIAAAHAQAQRELEALESELRERQTELEALRPDVEHYARLKSTCPDQDALAQKEALVRCPVAVNAAERCIAALEKCRRSPVSMDRLNQAEHELPLLRSVVDHLPQVCQSPGPYLRSGMQWIRAVSGYAQIDRAELAKLEIRALQDRLHQIPQEP